MKLRRLAMPAAAALVAHGQVAAAQARCGTEAEPGTGGMVDPGPDRVQQLLKLLAGQYGADGANPCKYAAANAAVRRSRRPDVVFMGDSITENWLDYDPALFAGNYVDRGIGGQTSAQMLLRFMNDVVMLRPVVVHIMAGTNDIAGNGGAITDDAIVANIAAMIDLAAANNIHVILAAIPPAKMFAWAPALVPAPRIRALNQRLRQLAAERGIGYADYYAVLADGDGGFRRGLSGDGVHPQHDGYAAMAPVAHQAIARALRDARISSSRPGPARAPGAGG